jgi:hypothetical protein
MLTLTITLSPHFLENFTNYSMDFSTDSFKTLLLSPNAFSSGSFSDWTYLSDITDEISGTGYTTGGESTTLTPGTPILYQGIWPSYPIHISGVIWPNSSFSARYAVLYKDTGTASTSPILYLINFGSTLTSTTAPFVITQHDLLIKQGAYQ